MWKHALEGCILGSDKCEECTIGEIPHTVVHWAIKYYECGNISSKIRNLNTHKSAQDEQQMRGMHYWGNPPHSLGAEATDCIKGPKRL